MKQNIGNFLSYLKIEKGCRKNTLIAYEGDLKQFFNYLEKEKLQEPQEINNIQTKDIRRFLVYLAERKGNGPASISRKITSLKAFFTFLKGDEIIQVDPTEKIGSPKRSKKLPKFLSVEELQKFLDLDKPLMHQAIIELLYATACRVSEVVNLNIENINMEELTIMIRSGKGAKDRLVMMTARAKKILEEYLTRELTEEQLVEKGINPHYRSKKEKINYLKKIGRFIPEESDQPVFIGRAGGRIDVRTIQGFIKKEGYDVELDVTPHKLRHTAASHLVMAGMDIRTLQKILGHESLDTTALYASVTLDHIKNEYQTRFPIQ